MSQHLLNAYTSLEKGMVLEDTPLATGGKLIDSLLFIFFSGNHRNHESNKAVAMLYSKDSIPQ